MTGPQEAPPVRARKTLSSPKRAPQVSRFPSPRRRNEGRVPWASLRGWVLVVLPPTTLVTALAFWFGYNYTATRTYYLGVDANMLGYSTIEYLLRSGEPVIVPIAVLLAVGLVVLTLHALVAQLLRRTKHSRAMQATFIVLIALGVFAQVLAIRGMFVSLGGYYLLPPILLGCGAALAGYSFHMLRADFDSKSSRVTRPEVPDWERAGYVIVTLLVILSLFWGMTLYAGALGTGRAQALENNLAARPGVKIYSKQSLALRHPAIVETKLETLDSDYRFEYSGLRLLVYSAGKYFLLPDNWTHESGTTFVLQDSSDIRIEFTPGKS